MNNIEISRVKNGWIIKSGDELAVGTTPMDVSRQVRDMLAAQVDASGNQVAAPEPQLSLVEKGGEA